MQEVVYNPNGTLEQCYYTWSPEGIDTIRAGFRVRAASEALNDNRSVRLQHLDMYLRYSLSHDFDPEKYDRYAPYRRRTPIKLTFTKSDGDEMYGRESLLVNSVYTSEDGIGRKEGIIPNSTYMHAKELAPY